MEAVGESCTFCSFVLLHCTAYISVHVRVYMHVYVVCVDVYVGGGTSIFAFVHMQMEVRGQP